MFQGGFSPFQDINGDGSWMMSAMCKRGSSYSGDGLPQEFDAEGAQIYYCDTIFTPSDKLYGWSLSATGRFRLSFANPVAGMRYRISVQINTGTATGYCADDSYDAGPHYSKTGQSTYSFYCTWEEADFENFPCAPYIVNTPWIAPSSPSGSGSYLAALISSVTIVEDPV